MGHRKKHKKAPDLHRMAAAWEKQLFDARQLVEISLSLNSNLDYHTLIQSILYICMGQLKVLKAGMFTRRDMDRQHLYLHRSVLGFEVTHPSDPVIPEDNPLLEYLQDHPGVHEWKHLQRMCPAASGLSALTDLSPTWVVPLVTRNAVNGVLILDEPIPGQEIGTKEKAYLMDIAALAAVAIHNAFLYDLATTDVMTCLKVRHHFLDILQDRMGQARGVGSPLALVMVDLDHFKDLNDTKGHLCGDEAIRKVASCMRAAVRSGDLAARYGGEEFMILLPDTDLSTAIAVAERLRLAIAGQALDWEGEKITVTASLGVTVLDADTDRNTRDFLERADRAMYMAKHAGRNTVVWLLPDSSGGTAGAALPG